MKLARFLNCFARATPAQPDATRIMFIADDFLAGEGRARLLDVKTVEFDIGENQWTVRFRQGLAVEKKQ